MPRPPVFIFHRPAQPGEPALVRLLADVRGRLIEHQSALFERAGDPVVQQFHRSAGATFGEVLAAAAPARGGLIVLSSGAVPRLRAADVDRLMAVATSDGRRALTNNRYSSDICAIGDAGVLGNLPPLPTDNALPRWLEERAGYDVAELRGRERLALDLDTPLDIALVGLAPDTPKWLREEAASAGLAVPRLAELRALAADPHRELIVFGRSGAATLRWLERNVRCRVRFLAEERGLRAASPLAIGGARRPTAGRLPRATLGRLLATRGLAALADVVTELGDGAIIDSRVLLADRLGADESAWPPPADRFASDLHRPMEVRDEWLRALTRAAAHSPQPILLGAHSLVGPGVPLLLRRVRRGAPFHCQ